MTALIVAHGHPRFNKGGAEIASYRLYQALRQTKGWEKSGFLAACPDDSMLRPGCEFLGLTDSEWLVRRSSDPLLHDTNLNLTTTVHGALHQAIKNLNPSVVHIHHYVHIGLDLLHALKSWFPDAKFIFTIHEYWAMCPYEGRLLKRNGRFCNGPEADECATCVGEDMRIELAVRRLRIARFFATIDQFISPSFFLKQRYVDWGIEAERIAVIENLPLPTHDVPSVPESITDVETKKEDQIVFAYFGQINRWKGIDIILEAFSVAVQKCPNIRLELHGLSSDLLFGKQYFHDQDFLLHCRRLLKRIPLGSIRLMGTYQPDELPSRLQVVDVVVMASRWYENAPMVIQEAFSNGVPVMAPNYGGMAEKIQHRANGWLFDGKSGSQLDELLIWVAKNCDILSEIKSQALKSKLRGSDVLLNHLNLYAELAAA